MFSGSNLRTVMTDYEKISVALLLLSSILHSRHFPFCVGIHPRILTSIHVRNKVQIFISHASVTLHVTKYRSKLDAIYMVISILHLRLFDEDIISSSLSESNATPFRDGVFFDGFWLFCFLLDDEISNGSSSSSMVTTSSSSDMSMPLSKEGKTVNQCHTCF